MKAKCRTNSEGEIETDAKIEMGTDPSNIFACTWVHYVDIQSAANGGRSLSKRNQFQWQDLRRPGKVSANRSFDYQSSSAKKFVIEVFFPPLFFPPNCASKLFIFIIG